MQQQIQKELDRLKSLGAGYADARWFPVEDSEQMVMINGNLKGNTSSTESGIGVRVLYKGAWGFSAASDTRNVSAVFDRALDNARAPSQRVTFPVRLAEKEALQATFTSPSKEDPFAVPMAEKVNVLDEMDHRMDAPGVVQRYGALNFIKKKIVYMDSEGSQIEKNITEVFAFMQVVGMDKAGVMQSRTFRLNRTGLTRGWESIDRAYFDQQAERIVSELNQLLVADDCPKMNGAVILKPMQMYLQTHETIGHALELDRILGYELAFAGGSFVTLEDFGKLRYGSEKLTVRADATVPNSPGSFGFDDDGVPAQDNLLIDHGILVGAITGRQMVEEANARARKPIFSGSSGANRATAFYRVPIERMTNINIDAGTDGTLDDIVSKTEHGVVLEGDRSWSIGSNREQFHFGTEMGWMVEDGKITRVIKNSTYQGDTLKSWNSLSAVGDESTWELVYVNNCGKGQPNQGMQLGHGIPVCRFDNVRIGE